MRCFSFAAHVALAGLCVCAPAHADDTLAPAIVVSATPLGTTAGTAGNWNGALPLPAQAASSTLIDLQAPDTGAAERIEDLAWSIPGTLPAINQAGLASALVIRGFALSRFHLDGLPDIGRLFVRDLAGVERIEVLRGPDAVMHGITDPGGVVEYVGKAPAFVAAHRISQSLGTHQLARSTVDLTGPLNDRLAYRLVASAREGQTHPGDLTEDRRLGLAALTWAYRDGAALTVTTEEQRNRQPYLFGTVITDRGVQYDRLYASDRQRNDRRYRRSGLSWHDALSDRLTLSARYAESTVHRDETLIGFWSLIDNDTLKGYATRYRDRYTQANWRIDGQLRLGDGPGEQWLVIGRDDNRYRFDFAGSQSIGGFNVDVAHPDFSNVDYDALATSARFNRETHRDTSWFVADRIALSQSADLTLGARQMHYAIASDRNGSGLKPAGEGDSLSWHLGLVGRPSAGLQLHLALTTGTTPNKGTTRSGEFLPPQRSRQLEAGGRWQALAGLEIGGALYRAVLENLPMTDPLDRTAQISAGRRRVTGAELLLSARHGPWSADAHGNWLTSTQLVKTAAWLGDAFPGVPRFNASLAIARTLPALAGPPLTVRLAAVHVGRRYGDAANSFQVHGYRRYDLGLHTRTGRFDLDLSVCNLFNTRYVEAVSALDDVYQGDLRRVVATASAHF